MAEVGRRQVCDPGALLPGGFWAAVAVWLERPQVANKRLCGARLEARRRATLPPAEARSPRLSPGPEQERGAALSGPQEGPRPGRSSVEGHPRPRPGLGPEEGTFCRRLEETQGQRQQGKEQREAASAPVLAEQPYRAGGAGKDDPAAVLDSLWDRFSRSLLCGRPEMLSFLTRSGAGSQSKAPRELDLVLRTVIPKTSPHSLVTAPRREMVVQEKWHSDGAVWPRPTWLGEELLGRLARWCVAHGKSEFRSTLSLISIERYSVLYQELKEKYREMVKVWPEVTDPEKFVYEDVAIAAYLLTLWEEERAERGVSTPQAFVDLGCGNGLLVHILCSEGHPGRGIDVRRRKIWDMYGPRTQLEEGAIAPSDRTLFPAADWLIGNHSDELTPWIPVIAARSSYHCRFFVLPCCFFDFTGRYCRRQSRKTQYREYLDFIQEVGEACGFRVEEDCLRIPSTKRVCLIGKSRTYLPGAEVGMDEQRTQYIRSRQGLAGADAPCPVPQVAACGAAHPDCSRAVGTRVRCDLEVSEAWAEGLWLPAFHAREKAIPVRNCAALPRDFINQVVLQVANLLLSGKKSHTGSPREGTCRTWNGGESLSLAEVAQQLDRATLRRLKSECGGLQTLLRNSHQVFEVLDGRVHIRDWRRELQRKRCSEAKCGPSSEAFKTRICWFFMHHPDGCVLPSTSCPFAHGPQELRPSRPHKKRQAP